MVSVLAGGFDESFLASLLASAAFFDGGVGLERQQFVLDPFAPQIAHFGVALGVLGGVRIDDDVLVDREVLVRGQQFVDQLHALVDALRETS